MIRLRSMPLKVKLPAVIVTFCLSTAIILQLANIALFKAEITTSLKAQLVVSARGHKAEVENWFLQRSDMLLGIAYSGEVQQALVDFAASYAVLPGAEARLKRAYITDNPNPIGQKQLLMTAGGPERYNEVHGNIHPYFAKMMDLKSIYDFFLFDMNGNLVYTYFKEQDFATNFDTGPYADSLLGALQRSARTAPRGSVAFSDYQPYAPSDNIPAGFIAAPVFADSGAVIGVVAAQVSHVEISNLLESANDPGDVFLVGDDGRTRSKGSHPGDPDIFSALPDLSYLKDIKVGASGFFENVVISSGNGGYALTESIDVLGVHWTVVTERDYAEVMAPLFKMYQTTAILCSIVALVILGLGVLVARSVTRPIDRIAAAIDAVGNGNLHVSLQDANRTDELGVIAKSLGGLVDKLSLAKAADDERERAQLELQDVVNKLSAGLRDLSAGNLSRPIGAAFPGSYEELRLNFNESVDKLCATITQVISASQVIRGRSTELSSASEDLSRRTENQAAALEQTAAALDELTSSVRSAADGAREVDVIVTQARHEAEQSGAVVQGAVAAMAEIEKSSEQISQIIGAIDDIAFQTNLLALNAGVEAARAGDAGKGFAVVASEVRALAQRSSSAAKEIKALIGASAQHVERGVDQVGKAGDALKSIITSVANISTLVSNIAAGAGEQSTALAEINIGVTQLDQVTQQNAAMVEQSTAASTSLHHDATGLAELVGSFSVPGHAAQPVPVVQISEFRAKDFASSASDNAVEQVGHATRLQATAGAGAKAMWQDF